MIGRNRKAYRENKKMEKWRKRLLHGLPGMKNEFGKTDLTPYNAARVISGKMSILDIKH